MPIKRPFSISERLKIALISYFALSAAVFWHKAINVSPAALSMEENSEEPTSQEETGMTYPEIYRYYCTAIAQRKASAQSKLSRAEFKSALINSAEDAENFCRLDLKTFDDTGEFMSRQYNLATCSSDVTLDDWYCHLDLDLVKEWFTGRCYSDSNAFYVYRVCNGVEEYADVLRFALSKSLQVK